MVAPFSKIYGKIWVSFCLNTGKRFFLRVSFSSKQKEHRFFSKTVLGIFKIALRLRDQHVFIWQLVEILNVFNALTLKQIFCKMKIYLKKTVFQLEAPKLKTHHCHTKLPYRKPMLRQIEWWVQNWPVTKYEVLPVTTLLFLKILF